MITMKRNRLFGLALAAAFAFLTANRPDRLPRKPVAPPGGGRGGQ
jgi:hypothetical protein